MTAADHTIIPFTISDEHKGILGGSGSLRLKTIKSRAYLSRQALEDSLKRIFTTRFASVQPKDQIHLFASDVAKEVWTSRATCISHFVERKDPPKPRKRRRTAAELDSELETISLNGKIQRLRT